MTTFGGGFFMLWVFPLRFDHYLTYLTLEPRVCPILRWKGKVESTPQVRQLSLCTRTPLISRAAGEQFQRHSNHRIMPGHWLSVVGLLLQQIRRLASLPFWDTDHKALHRSGIPTPVPRHAEQALRGRWFMVFPHRSWPSPDRYRRSITEGRNAALLAHKFNLMVILGGQLAQSLLKHKSKNPKFQAY